MAARSYLVYRPSLLPDRQRLFEVWRARAKELGIGEILICNAMTFGEFDPRDVSCDAAVEFPPHTVSTMEVSLSDLDAPAAFTGKVYDYVDAVRSSLGKTYDFPYFPAVMPRWDNTPRKGSRGHVFNRSSPEAFEVWLRDATRRAQRAHLQSRSSSLTPGMSGLKGLISSRTSGTDEHFSKH